MINNSSIEEFYLDGNLFGFEGARLIMRAVQKNKVFKAIKLGFIITEKASVWNRITSFFSLQKSMKSQFLLESLGSIVHLQTLDLSGNELNSSDAKNLSNIIMINRSRKTLRKPIW
jgi:Ran GTPase-activating protein (RanGAP) involved in mRNA processing and transport